MQTFNKHPPAYSTQGTRVALLFALTAHRLQAFYEHGQPLSVAQGAALAADWLTRSQRTLPLDERIQLSTLSQSMASEMTRSLSREAGLFTTHEMLEALDPNYRSELAESLLCECQRLLDGVPENQGSN